MTSCIPRHICLVFRRRVTGLNLQIWEEGLSSKLFLNGNEISMIIRALDIKLLALWCFLHRRQDTLPYVAWFLCLRRLIYLIFFLSMIIATGQYQISKYFSTSLTFSRERSASCRFLLAVNLGVFTVGNRALFKLWYARRARRHKTRQTTVRSCRRIHWIQILLLCKFSVALRG